MKVFYSLPRLIDYADQIVATKDVVSIDIFDTLFIRRIHDPDMVKFPVARFIATTAAELGIGISWRQVWDQRDKIEAEHRHRNGESFPDHEACYDDYMSELLAQIFGDQLPADYLDTVADYEMRMESAVIVPRMELMQWIKRLHNSGKRILLISDIYLPSKYLQRLVTEKGLSEYVDDVISSADSFNAKASGTGYPLVRDKHGLSYDTWLHIGDNGISDGVRASEHGITALVIRDLKEKQRKGIARLINHYASIKHLWKGRNIQQFMLPLEAENADRSPLFVHGHNLFGFIIGYFIQGLAEQCRSKGLRRIYFCSREGWMFYQCWQRMAPHLFPDGSAPEASYLHVSRVGLSQASCSNVGLTFLDAAVALLPAQNQDFLDMCRIFRLDVEKLRPMLDRAGLAEEDVITAIPPGDALSPSDPFARLLADPEFQQEVKRQGIETRDILDQYLGGEGFFDHADIALVDIGWLGTIQHYLNQAIAHRPQRPRIHGFLLAATRMVPYPNTDECRYSGLVFDQFKFNLAGSFILTIKDILEEVCRAPHPSVIGYEHADNAARPVFRNGDGHIGQAEQEQSEHFEPLQQGVFDAVERFAGGVVLFDYPNRHLKSWLNLLLVSRLAFPKAREVEKIRHIAHQDDFASDRKVAKKILKHHQSLWDINAGFLRLVPFVKLRYFLLHISRMMRIWS